MRLSKGALQNGKLIVEFDQADPGKEIIISGDDHVIGVSYDDIDWLRDALEEACQQATGLTAYDRRLAAEKKESP